MPSWSTFPAFIGMVIPIASLLAVMVAVFLFVTQKGSMDALKDTADTYKGLAEGYKATLDQMKDEFGDLLTEFEELKKKDAARDQAMQIAIDELIAGFERAGYERKS